MNCLNTAGDTRGGKATSSSREKAHAQWMGTERRWIAAGAIDCVYANGGGGTAYLGW